MILLAKPQHNSIDTAMTRLEHEPHDFIGFLRNRLLKRLLPFRFERG